MYSTPGIEASNFVASFNTSFYFIVGVSLLLLVGLTAAMIYFIFRYNKKKNPVATQIEGSMILEVTWTVIPIILSLVMFYVGWEGWKPTTKPPKDAMNVTCVARMWNFLFVYENGKQSPDLIIPVNTAIRINMVSVDVIHSLFIPEFRVKSDIVPGRNKFMWFLSPRVDKYKIFCAEYCGLQHSYMHATVDVMTKEKFDKWYAESAKPVIAAGAAPGAVGEAIMKAQGCFACHTTDGSKLIGPSYLNLFGSQQVVVRDGKEMTITVDAAYVRESILEPGADVTKGYPNGLMQSYRNTVSDDDINKIVEFLKTLNDK
jgi:cytochrome c oxidase subunit 2